MTNGLVHDGDPVLARHVGNAVLKFDARGRGHIVKPQKSSEAHVDAAAAMVFAFDSVVKRSGVGAGWLQHFRNEIAKQQSQQDEPPPETSSTSGTAAEPRAEVTAPSPSPRDILLGPGAALPGRPSACQHRWMRESWGMYCVHCGEKR